MVSVGNRQQQLQMCTEMEPPLPLLYPMEKNPGIPVAIRASESKTLLQVLWLQNFSVWGTIFCAGKAPWFCDLEEKLGIEVQWSLTSSFYWVSKPASLEIGLAFYSWSFFILCLWLAFVSALSHLDILLFLIFTYRGYVFSIQGFVFIRRIMKDGA